MILLLPQGRAPDLYVARLQKRLSRAHGRWLLHFEPRHFLWRLACLPPPKPRGLPLPGARRVAAVFLIYRKASSSFPLTLKKSGATPPIYPLELETLDSSGAQIGFNSLRAKLFNPVRKPGHIRLCAPKTRQGRKIHPGQTNRSSLIAFATPRTPHQRF